MEKLPEDFNMVELLAKAEERTPYQVVALQECERMNFLTQEIRRTLRELGLGLKVSREIKEITHLSYDDSNILGLVCSVRSVWNDVGPRAGSEYT